MKKAWTWIAAAVMIAALAVAFAGCGSEPQTLADYLSDNPDAKQEIEDSLAPLQNDDMSLSVAYEGNKIIVVCQLKETYEGDLADSVKRAYDESADVLKNSMEASVRDIEESTEISGVTVDFVVRNGDGSEIWKGNYGSV